MTILNGIFIFIFYFEWNISNHFLWNFVFTAGFFFSRKKLMKTGWILWRKYLTKVFSYFSYNIIHWDRHTNHRCIWNILTIHQSTSLQTKKWMTWVSQSSNGKIRKLKACIMNSKRKYIEQCRLVSLILIRETKSSFSQSRKNRKTKNLHMNGI